MASYLDASWAVQSSERQSELVEVVGGQANSAALLVVTVTHGLIQILNVAVLLVAAMVLAPIGAVAMLGGGVFIFLLVRPLARRTRTHSRDRIHAQLSLSRELHEAAGGISEARVFGVVDEVHRSLDGRIDAVTATWRRAEVFHRLVPSTYHLLAMSALVGALGLLYATGANATAMGAVVLIMIRALASTQGLTGTINRMYELSPLLELIDERLRAYEQARSQWGDLPLAVIEEIRFEDVTYDYGLEATPVRRRPTDAATVDAPVPGLARLAREHPDASELTADDAARPAEGEPALCDVSFSVRRGDAIGVVGPSGAGKSTLVQVLLGLRVPTSGHYLVNGRDAYDYAERDWYTDLALVPQHPFLIEGTIAENIAFYRPGIAREDIERGARLANVHDEIMSWPAGYDTPVSERGGSLSGGQRQRVSLARAFAGRPSLLILDEPTSALDLQSEALIRDALEAAKQEMSLFVIAHRLTTLAVCDRIMVLRRGRLESMGPASELLDTNDFYREAVELSQLA
jgi:ABC-type multidrug transport system fused ATPase/permease subunit